MSLYRIKYENKIILNFDEAKFSKYLIIKSLRNAEILNYIKNDISNETIYRENIIHIGTFDIKLILTDLKSSFRLKDYGFFQIKIYNNGNEINLLKDNIFKDQYWVYKNNESKLKIKDLIDVVYFCKRIQNLQIFS